MMSDRLLTLTLTLTLCNVIGAMVSANGEGNGNGPRIPIKDTSILHVPGRCVLNAETGRCRASMRKYHFNVKSGQCEPFVYGGCGGNGNRFDSLSDCHKTCTCRTAPETGHCRGHFRRWFYSPADGCCRPFIYGGCGGNNNNHATWTECSNMCGYPTQDSKWWDWGADWWRWNGQMNQTGGQAGANTYSRGDFMRDWLLWRLLTGGEGELEMENLATLIAQAHVMGFGRATGVGIGSGSGSGSSMGSGSGAGYGSGYGSGSGTGYGYGYGSGFGAGAGYGAGYGVGSGTGAGYGAGYGSGAAGVGSNQGGASMGAKSNLGQGSGFSLGDTQAALAYFQRFFGGEAEAGSGLAGMLAAGGLGPAYNVQRQGSFTPLGHVGSIENMVGLGAGMYNNHDTNGETNVNGGGYNGLHQWGTGQYGQGAQTGQGQAGGYNQWGTGQYGQGQSGQGVAGSMNQWGTGQFGQGQSGQGVAGSMNQWGTGQFGQRKSGQGQAGYSNHWGSGQFGQGQSGQGQMGSSDQWGVGQSGQGQSGHGQSGAGGAGSAGSAGIKASAGAAGVHGSWGQSSSQALGNTRNGWAPHGETVLPYGQGGVVANILRLIGQLSSGNLKPVDLVSLGQRFGALQPDGKVNVEVLARGMVNSLKGPAGQVHLTGLNGIAKTLGALDAKGNINVNLMMKEIAKSLSRGNKELGKTISGGNLFGQSGGSGQIVSLIGKWGSGKLKPTDFIALARRFGAMQPNGKVNVDVLAQRMVSSLQGPAGQAQLAQMKGVAKALGALDGNGNINVNLMMKKIAKSISRENKEIGKTLSGVDLSGHGGGSGQIVSLIGQWVSGKLKPADFIALARRFGAMQPNGKVNVDVLAQRMVSSLQGPAGQAQLAQLKGVAKALGALDVNGNINVNLMMKKMAKAFGKGSMGAGIGAGTGAGAGAGQFGTGQGGGSGSIQASGTVFMGGKNRKAYGKK